MPTLETPHRIWRSIHLRIIPAVVAFGALAGTSCGNASEQSEPTPAGGEPTSEGIPEAAVGEVEPWIMNGPNLDVPLADLALDDWAAGMEEHGLAELPQSSDEMQWVGTSSSGLTATGWGNEDGVLTELSCSANQAPTVEAVVAAVETCYTGLDVDGFDPGAATDWLDTRINGSSDAMPTSLANKTFGPIGLMMLDSNNSGGEYSVTIILRPTDL